MIKLPEIVFRELEQSDAIEAAVNERIERLEKFYQPIQGCTVVIDAPHRHQHKGRIYSVSIDLSVPGDELVVSRDPQKNHAHEDVYVAIRDSFEAMERQLKKFAEMQRGDVKRHDPMPQGRVADLLWEEGYGFIETNGRRIYFHKNAVVNGGFDELEEGTPVEFVESMGDEGPQASTVRAISSLKAVTT
jgi:ribosomal subunit interface protein